jgi:arylsulfatase
MFTRQQEVFAGFLTHTDAQIGRVLDALSGLGYMDNTMVVVFSDNGASAEGGTQGTFNEHRFTAHGRESLAENLAHYDDWGGYTTYNHYSWGWAWAGNAPHRLWKRYTWLGGTRTPLIVHWPGHVASPGTVRTQFTHAIDLMPTVLEAAGLEVPEQVDGVAQQPLDGLSLLPALGDPAVPETRRTQYFEMLGSRAIYHDGWKATTDHISTGVLDEEELAIGSRSFDEDRWELFDLETDFSEAHDRAADEPERLRHLTDLWTAEAARNNVLPISDGLVDRLAGFVPAAWPAGTDRVFRPGGGPVCDESVPLLWGGFRMTAEVDADAGAEGVIFALGDWFGGYAMYAVDGRVHFSFARSVDTLELASPEPLAEGRHEIGVFYGLGADHHGPGRMVLLVDGAAADETVVEGPLPLALQHGGAGLRLGHDTGFPVSPRYKPPAPYAGVVHRLRVEAPGALEPDPDDEVRAALHAD